jgi:signal transduction histidine kinase
MNNAPALPLNGDLVPGYLSGKSAWLIQLRWYGAAGALLTVLVSAYFGWLTALPQLLTVVGLIFAANLAFHYTQRRNSGLSNADESQLLAIQLCMDMCLLTLLLHWSGGIENPFAMCFVILSAISTMLLSFRNALTQSSMGVLLFGSTIVAEALGFLPHYPLLIGSGQQAPSGELWRTPLFVSGYLCAFTMVMYGVQYFVHAVESERSKAEQNAREKERVALSREKLARIGELSAGVAHTIRNPLHGAMNCVELLRMEQETLSPDARSTLELMTEGLTRIELVTQRLLTLTREPNMNLKPTDLNRLVRDSMRFINVRSMKKSVPVQTDLNDVPELELDRDKINEVLINLVDNAVYACKGQGEVTVSTYLSSPNQERVVLEVSDTGSGIPADQIEHIFDPFFTTKAIGEGSGLGLPIARRITEQHDGDIRAESKPGSGTSIKLLLPTPVASGERTP